MINKDSENHLSGKSIFLDDIPEIEGTIYGLVYDSPYAHAKINRVDYSEALKIEGVRAIITYKDVLGENQIGVIVQDETLFAENAVHYIGQPIALIVAESEEIAREAKKHILLEVEQLPIVTDPRISKEKRNFIIAPRTFKLGDCATGRTLSNYNIKGSSFSGGQEHLYLETQGAYAVPQEGKNIKIFSSTQGPTSVQKITSRVLGIPMNAIEVDVNRLGGGFGGKEDQATPWAVMAGLAASLLERPVKIVLNRKDDIRMTGKRHPYFAEYEIGLSEDLKIQYYQVEFIQDAGAAADLSPAIMERTLFHGTGSYYIPNTEITVYSCRTNTPPNTAFRGFGAPQAFFAIESAIHQAAELLNIPAYLIQEANLLKEGNEFPYGQKAKGVYAKKSMDRCTRIYGLKQKLSEIQSFNSENKTYKKGLSVIPICFGISFTNTTLNQARALVHVYQDGSVGISTGAVEMGQSVNTKMKQIACQLFSIHPVRVNIEHTNTSRVANTAPTAASSGADLNGKAVETAIKAISIRLKTYAGELLNVNADNIELINEFIYSEGKKTDITWEKLIELAWLKRIQLSEKGHYATPEIHYDKAVEKGQPFAYHVYGTAITVAKIDCMRGTYTIESVEIVHDFGKSMNPIIDRGQIEGALMQGIGWVTMEEIRVDESGFQLANTLSTYKVPDIYSAPGKVQIHDLETEGSEYSIFNSKAVGEPPFIYGIGSYFALLNASKAFNPDFKIIYSSPMTHEKLLFNLYKTLQS
jgi:xanthine dehydrogenase large subunit